MFTNFENKLVNIKDKKIVYCTLEDLNPNTCIVTIGILNTEIFNVLVITNDEYNENTHLVIGAMIRMMLQLANKRKEN